MIQFVKNFICLLAFFYFTSEVRGASQLQHGLNSTKQVSPITFNQKSNASNLGSFVSIGTDNACDFQFPTVSLQQVIDISGAAEIRMVSGLNFAPITINNSITLKGGYDNCAAAFDDLSGTELSIINGTMSATHANIRIAGASGVELHQLLIQNSMIGGVSILNSSGIKIKNSNINNNQSSTTGGGLLISTDVDLVLEDVKIFNNSSEDNGGGIACFNSSMLMTGESSINQNFSQKDGGGMYAVTCDLTLIGGGIDSGFTNNSADQFGGGMFIEGNSDVFISGAIENIENETFGNSSAPFLITGNSAALSGGGVFFGSVNAIMNVEMKDVSVKENIGFNGGGIYVTGTSVNFLLESDSQSCWSDIACNYIGYNSAENRGGGLVVTGSAQGLVRAANIRGNRANEGIAAFVGGFGSLLTLESSFLSKNGDGGISDGYNDLYLIGVNNDASINLNHVSAIDNDAITSVINANNSNINITNSILYNPETGPYLTLNNSLAVSQCLLLDDEFNNASADAVLMNEDDYIRSFHAPQNGDYHLALTATIAVDQCPTLPININDIDGEAFQFDDPFVSNGAAVLADAGADEIYNRSIDPMDLIFIDGFED